MMRTISAAAVAVALSAAPASAGVTCFGEVSTGKSITATELDDSSFAGKATVSVDGLQGGVGIGCDVSLDRVVIGALARYELMDLNTRIGDGNIGADAQWMLALRGGIKINPGTLVYGLFGIAGTELSYPGLNIDPTGIVYGAGLEFDVAVQNLSMFVEWSRTELDRKNIDGMTSLDPHSDTFRVGVRLKFDLAK